MKYVLSFCFFLFSITITFAQEIVNVVLVGDNGITENVKEAHSFIIVKKYPGSFQRLDYKRGAPLQRLKTYSDSTLTELSGAYYEYDESGGLKISGNYANNKKEKDWYFYNDTGKVTRYETYEDGILVKTTDPDTLKKESKIDKVSDVETEATFAKGQKGWVKYLTSNLKADLAAQSVNGGNVVVQFVVNTEGKCINVHLFKSVEFILDEEAIRVIEKSPTWNPAVQEGKKVNAYRRQPITFVKN